MPFWFEDPKELVSNLSILPTQAMKKEDRINSLSRLAIVVALVLYYYQSPHWLVFLLGSLLILGLMYYSKNPVIEPYGHVRALQNHPEVHQGTIVPVFNEFQHFPEPQHTVRPQSVRGFRRQRNYASLGIPERVPEAEKPFGQYITSSNIPHNLKDSLIEHQIPLEDAKRYALSEYTRNEVNRRNDLARVYAWKRARRFRHENDIMGDLPCEYKYSY